MYNRYIRNDKGSYTCIPEEEPPERRETESRVPPPPPPGDHTDSPPQGGGRSQTAQGGGAPGRVMDGLTGFLQHVLDQLHMDHVDTGDLLLLALLFFLFREDADEELLVSLGLLLIL